MRVISYSEFSNHISKNFDAVVKGHETIMVEQEENNNVILISQSEYNSILETLHLVSSANNKQRLDDAINEMNSGKFYLHDLIED